MQLPEKPTSSLVNLITFLSDHSHHRCPPLHSTNDFLLLLICYFLKMMFLNTCHVFFYKEKTRTFYKGTVSYSFCQHHTGVTLPLFVVAPCFSSLGRVPGTQTPSRKSCACRGNMRAHVCPQDSRWAEGYKALR